MKVPVVAVLLLLLVSGCATRPPSPTGPHLLDDGADESIAAFADLLWAGFRELNGSVVLFMEYRNMTGRIPEFVATFQIEGGIEGRWFLRSQPNFSKPPSNLEYVIGRVTGNEYRVLGQVCALTEITRGPWLIRVEAEHNTTGLLDGGRIVGLEIHTSDFEGNAMDSAQTEATFQVRGGRNPHTTCPLHAERPE